MTGVCNRLLCTTSIGWNQVILSNSNEIMPEKPHIPFVPPTFSWDSPNYFSQFKIYKQKVEFALYGHLKESNTAFKVCAILNWLDDKAYKIYKHLHWVADDDKNDPEVLKAFESYFKPEQNQFHSW